MTYEVDARADNFLVLLLHDTNLRVFRNSFLSLSFATTLCHILKLRSTSNSAKALLSYRSFACIAHTEVSCVSSSDSSNRCIAFLQSGWIPATPIRWNKRRNQHRYHLQLSLQRTSTLSDSFPSVYSRKLAMLSSTLCVQNVTYSPDLWNNPHGRRRVVHTFSSSI